ncbi:MAG: UDP-N-acetylmuramate dehydrogenase [Flavobacteriaceae bacterium]|nr:UDP-N-acetylmuramate dehydrogenase [Bacteroidia bacterium]NNL60271.1 UDP-N-acetylmuramate dehydrogenase [Flavobacteriaceae bacterium]
MQILENISLKPYNTFGIDVKARLFVSIDSISELKECLSIQEYPHKFILGGGSNILLTKDIEAMVIHMNLRGITVISETESHVVIKAGAGENWHEFVMWCLNNDYGGIENLSLIPGNTGTAPIQNIGAYGVELKDVFIECTVIDRISLETKTFTNSQCKFGYRDSIFKGSHRNKYIITDVTFNLTKKNHELHCSYGAISSKLSEMGVNNPTIQDISKAVIAIRSSKLPNPSEIGNSGSFFKNPVVSLDHFDKLKVQFPEIPNYPASSTSTKIPAGWLIEKAGFKGKRFNDHGVHEKQALVLVNYGSAKGEDILKLAKLIQATVHRIFDVSLETEVNIL